MDIAMLIGEAVGKIFLLGLIAFSGACLTAIFWAVYVFNKEEEYGNDDEADD